MTSKLFLYNKTLLFGLFCLLIGACNQLPEGFVQMDDAIAKKLNSFGAGDINAGQAEFVLLHWEIMGGIADSTKNIHEALWPIKRGEGVIKNERIKMDLMTMEDGANVEYLAPPAAFSHTSINSSEHFKVTVDKCFKEARAAAHYLATAASEGLRSEEECMDLYTMLREDLEWVAFNDLWLGFHQRTNGDSIKVDKQIVIEYNTFLLGGQRLDSLTSMEFEFGKTGQLLPGMQWGLAKMREGESALILCPSKWAFGEDGAVGGHVPPRTPVYWDVRVVSVED